jgi:hypothetical protein
LKASWYEAFGADKGKLGNNWKNFGMTGIILIEPLKYTESGRLATETNRIGTDPASTM